MRFTVTRNSIMNAVKEMLLAISPKPTLQVMSDVKFTKTDGNSFIVSATDSEVFLSDTISLIEIDEPSDFLVNASDLLRALTNVPEQPLKFEVSENELVCRYHGGKFKIPHDGANADSWPMFPDYDLNAEDTLQSALASRTLQYATANASKYVSTNTIHPTMCGMCLAFLGDRIDYVATDGHALFKLSEKKESNIKENIVLSSRVMGVISKLTMQSDDITIVANKTNIFFQIGDTELIARRVEGRYPAYDRVIPATMEINAEFATADMISAIKRVSVMSSTENVLNMRFDDSNIHIEASDLTFSKEASEDVCAHCTGNLKVGYKSNLLLNVLSLLGETATMQLVNNTMPCKFTEKTEYGDLTCVVMPVMINT